MSRAALLLAACALVAALWSLGEHTADVAAAWQARELGWLE